MSTPLVRRIALTSTLAVFLLPAIARAEQIGPGCISSQPAIAHHAGGRVLKRQPLHAAAAIELAFLRIPGFDPQQALGRATTSL
jgi:hypothetical protein